MRRMRVEGDCACVVEEIASIEADRGHAMARRAMGPWVVVASNEQCDRLEVPAARIVGVGVSGRSIDWTITKNVLLSWGATLPIAASAAFAISHML